MQFQMHILEWKLHIWIKISLKIALKDLVDKQLSLVQVMAWHQTGNKPLSETRLTKMLDTTRNITYQWDQQQLYNDCMAYDIINNTNKTYIIIIVGHITHQWYQQIIYNESMGHISHQWDQHNIYDDFMDYILNIYLYTNYTNITHIMIL